MSNDSLRTMLCNDDEHRRNMLERCSVWKPKRKWLVRVHSIGDCTWQKFEHGSTSSVSRNNTQWRQCPIADLPRNNLFPPRDRWKLAAASKLRGTRKTEKKETHIISRKVGDHLTQIRAFVLMLPDCASITPASAR